MDLGCRSAWSIIPAMSMASTPVASRVRPKPFLNRSRSWARTFPDRPLIADNGGVSVIAYQSPDDTGHSPVPIGVLMGASLLLLSVAPLLAQLPHEPAAADAALPLIAWLPLGIVGTLLLDRQRGSLLGWASVVAATTPTVLLLVGYLHDGGDPGESDLAGAASSFGPLTLIALALPALACTSQRGRSRGDRRWAVWIVSSCIAAVNVATFTWYASTPAVYGIAATTGIGIVAALVATSVFVRNPRPLIEPIVDVALVAGGLAAAAASGAVVLNIARHEQIIAAEALSGIATAATAVLAVPTIWWLRTQFLARRYGTGVLSVDDVAVLTADLKSAADPRLLLVKAGAMVTRASGVHQTHLVLDDAEVPEGWVGKRLMVADELVGTMLLHPSHSGGLEARQDRVCRQLQPTIALVARAVALAVDADHARRDIAHQRDVERARMLADLHDDLGPVLAGMSMRVQAARDTHQLAELDALAADLAACRTDLRRIVAGLAPAALDTGDLASAITSLIASFDTGNHVRVTLATDVPERIDARTSVLIYRLIGEGITNAIKHANPTTVNVRVERNSSGLCTSVTDDGIGGIMCPGIGLTSLRDRAEEIGATLKTEMVKPTGTALVLTVPETRA